MTPEDRRELAEWRDRIDALRLDLKSGRDDPVIGSTATAAAGHLDVAWRILDNALERAKPRERILEDYPGDPPLGDLGGAPDPAVED